VAAGPFSGQPSGPRPVGDFSALLSPQVSISDMLVVRALKNRQLTSSETNVIFGTGH
jgi:hypothetical protein